MVAVSEFVPSRMTVDEFLSRDAGDESGRLWELVDGEPVAMAPGSQNHGALQGEIGRRIAGNHLREARPGCRLIVTPGVVPHLSANRTVPTPEFRVSRVRRPRPNWWFRIRCRRRRILSPSNEVATWRNVWADTTIPTVTEILAVRSTRIEAELLATSAGRELAEGAGDFREWG